MNAYLHCLSHTPLVGYVDPEQAVLDEVNGTIADARARIAAFDPELVVLFAPGHAVLIGRCIGLDWPGMAFRWADGLAVVLLLGALALPLRHLLLADLRDAATKADWRLMALLVLLPFTGLLARSGLPGYSLWLLLHLVAGHVFLWCAPHCRFARLLR